MDQMACGLNFPTSLAFDDDGNAWVAESGLPFDGSPSGGRVVRLESDGTFSTHLDGLRSPLNGLTWHDGGFYVAEGGNPGRLGRWVPGEPYEVVLDGLPGGGNYHTNMVVVGDDDWLYFSQGALTNMSVVGPDGLDMAWLRTLDHSYDIPGRSIVLADSAATIDDPRTNGATRSTTGAFAPYGQRHDPLTRLDAQLPCTASVMRVRPDGTQLELVAWGVRNAWGLAFLPDGRLVALDQGADVRGSRPIANCPDALFHIEHGAWYGWPDFVAGDPVTAPRFRPDDGDPLDFVLANHDELPRCRAPLMRLPVNCAASRLTVIDHGPWKGQIIVALFGDEKPLTAPAGPPAGRSIARIDPTDWSLHPLHSEDAPTNPQAERPIDVRFEPRSGLLWLLDFGHFEMLGAGGLDARRGSGALWTVDIYDVEKTR